MSVRELQREIKQALQLKHNELVQLWEGFQGSMLCDKAITSWLTGTLPIPFFFTTLLSAEYAVSEYYLALLHYSAPSLLSSVIVMLLFLSTYISLSPFFFNKGMFFILHNRSWRIARSLVLSPPIFLGEIRCFCRQECMLTASRCSHYILLFPQYHMYL